MKHHPSNQLLKACMKRRSVCIGSDLITYHSSWAGLDILSGLPVQKYQVSAQLGVEVPFSPSVFSKPRRADACHM